MRQPCEDSYITALPIYPGSYLLLMVATVVPEVLTSMSSASSGLEREQCQRLPNPNSTLKTSNNY